MMIRVTFVFLVMLTRLGADTVVLKNGLVLRGTVDKDNTIVSVFDGIKRTIVKDTRIQSTEVKDSFPNLEGFQYYQPLIQHGGSMPAYAIEIQSEPWDKNGRRRFSYKGPKPTKPMTQAINFLNPRFAKYRGVDGFWLGQISTNQIPRPTIMELLRVVDKASQAERLRAGRFLIQAEMYPEAKASLEKLALDYPDLKETIEEVRKTVCDLEARQILDELTSRRRGGQPRKVLAGLKAFPAKDVSPEILSDVQELLSKDEDQAEADRALVGLVQMLADELIPKVSEGWSLAIVEVLGALTDAPDAVRNRVEGMNKPEAKTIPQKFALAMSGWVIGADLAVSDLAKAKKLWELRGLVTTLVNSANDAERARALALLQADDPGIDIVVRIIDRLAPASTTLPAETALVENAPRSARIETKRVLNDNNAQPTEYMVRLPTDYSPYRQYPTVVALHIGFGPATALKFWGEEADKRGYIVVAPEYNTPGQRPDYTYSISEHAAVELALRDAKKRYNIDSDRVFLGGQVLGANMAWDFGLAHPDMFAGVMVVSGIPAKYVNKYLPNTEKVPLYVVEGDLAPSANEMIFGVILKPMISRGWDVTYTEYYKRGMEDFPEEVPSLFNWMDKHKREPFPKTFSGITARASDDRFYGVVIKEFAKDTIVDPSAVEPLGKNITKPAKIEGKLSATANLLNLTMTGVKRADIWLSPKMIDFSKKVEVKVNGDKWKFKGIIKPDYGPMLEDLRLRGDRKQLYWARLVVK